MKLYWCMIAPETANVTGFCVLSLYPDGYRNDSPQGEGENTGGAGVAPSKGSGVAPKGGFSKGGDEFLYDLRCVLYHKGSNVHSGHIVVEVGFALVFRSARPCRWCPVASAVSLSAPSL